MAQADFVPSAVCVLITGAGPKPSTNSVVAAYAAPGGTGRHSPQPILLDSRVIDIDERSDHWALWAYLIAILDQTEQNVPGGLDLRQIAALLSDLASTVAGTLQNAVECMARRVA